jgi:GMP synthase-like glutamine amidotransferase
MRILILQHTPTNPAGIYRRLVEERGATATVVEVEAGEPIPDLTDFDAVITMGGHMGVNDVEEHPWLLEEMDKIRDGVRSGVPYWGVCLGGQLLAASLGARVDRLPSTEVGFPSIRLPEAAERDPVFSRVPRPLQAFVYHDDAFGVPEGAVLLGGTAESNQAFRWGERAYGVQFHLEATPEMVRGWMDEDARAALERQLGPGAAERLLTELERRQAEQEATARVLTEAWLEAVVGRPAQQPAGQLGPPGVKGEEGV